MKQLIATAVLCLCAALARNGAAASLLIYADDGYPPYTYVEQGRLTGIYTGIVQRALQAMPQYQVELRAVPWQRGISLLQAGKIFAMYPPYAMRAERPDVIYSVPLMTEHVIVFCNSDVAARRKLARWPDDYRGLRIGLNTGFLVADAGFIMARQAGAFVMDTAKGTRTNLLKLMRGRIDCYINDRLSTQWEWQRLQREGQVGPGMLALQEMTQLADQHVYLAYSRKYVQADPFRDDFMRQFNAAVLHLQQTGEVQRLVAQALRQ